MNDQDPYIVAFEDPRCTELALPSDKWVLGGVESYVSKEAILTIAGARIALDHSGLYEFEGEKVLLKSIEGFFSNVLEVNNLEDMQREFEQNKPGYSTEQEQAALNRISQASEMLDRSLKRHDEITVELAGDQAGYRTKRLTIGGGTEFTPIRFQHIWGADEEEISKKIDEQIGYWQGRIEFMKEHRLGQGGTVLADEYGGINVEDIEAASSHLVLKAIIARQAGLRDVGELVTTNLLHPLLATFLSKPLADLFKSLGDQLAVADHMTPEDTGTIGSVLMSAATEKARKFIVQYRDDIMLTALTCGKPDLAKKVLEAGAATHEDDPKRFSVKKTDSDVPLLFD